MFLVIFGLAGAGILVSLGVWQVQRLAWKQDLLSNIETRIAADPQRLPSEPDAEVDRYTPVQVDGVFLPGEVHVLVSVKRVGPGFRIIAPFQTNEGRLLLVDRGFVPDDQKDTARSIDPVMITGNLDWPRESDQFTPEPDLAANTWFARDVPQLALALDTEPVLVVARSQTDPGVTPLPVDTTGIPNDHLQYAITWFSLAVIWIAMTAYFLWRTRAQRET